MNAMGPMGGAVQNQPAPPYRQPAGGKPGVNVGGMGPANVTMQQNPHMQQVKTHFSSAYWESVFNKIGWNSDFEGFPLLQSAKFSQIWIQGDKLHEKKWLENFF